MQYAVVILGNFDGVKKLQMCSKIAETILTLTAGTLASGASSTKPELKRDCPPGNRRRY